MTPQELKNSILQLAIQGKLVQQRAEEGTGAELLCRIREEKQRLMKEGKLKKEKPLPEITEDEKPFDIPESWEWVRVGEICSLIRGITFPGSAKSATPFKDCVRCATTGSVQKTYNEQADVFVPLQYIKNELQWLEAEDIVVSSANSKELVGKSCLWQGTEKMTFGGFLTVARVLSVLDKKYVFAVMRHLHQSGVFARESTQTTNIANLNNDKLSKFLIPLPPLAEQKRIVAKIEELLPLIDRYAQAWEKLEDFNKRFPTDMQKSILQMAIQGKIVEQRPEEGTGEEVYRLIQMKQGALKSNNNELNYDAMDFSIPENWKWVELNQIFRFVDYRGKTPNKISEGIFLITASNIRQGYMDYTRKEYISAEEYETRKSRGVTRIGDLLFTTEAPMGNVALCDLEVCSCGQRIITFQEYEEDTAYSKLYMYFILSPQFQQQLLDNCTGTTAKGIKAEKLKHFLLPLPPLAEQRRIVAKLEELLPLCERLK